jgi:hypothetical protein
MLLEDMVSGAIEDELIAIDDAGAIEAGAMESIDMPDMDEDDMDEDDVLINFSGWDLCFILSSAEAERP